MISPCSETDFTYPLKTDIYYPIVDQGAYGNLTRQWVYDRTIACSFSPAGTAWAEEVKPNRNIVIDENLLGRVKEDPRISLKKSKEFITNVILTNIRTKNDTPIYIETAGSRSGKSTIFEIATNQPIVGPFGEVEYYKLVIRRSENQATDI
jgi:hypothetical protein